MSHIIFTKNGHGRVPTLGHRNPAIFARAWSAIGRMGKAFGKRVAEARRMARAYDELAAMSDLELHDIGISRADIPAAVSGAYSLWKVEIASFRAK